MCVFVVYARSLEKKIQRYFFDNQLLISLLFRYVSMLWETLITIGGNLVARHADEIVQLLVREYNIHVDFDLQQL